MVNCLKADLFKFWETFFKYYCKLLLQMVFYKMFNVSDQLQAFELLK